MRQNPKLVLLLFVVLLLNACGGYRLVRPEEVEWPTYEARAVPIPERCTELIRRAAEQGMETLREVESREVQFCQQQQLVRAQEEEAAAARLEAHAAAANFALRVTVFAIGGVVAILAWAF